MLRYKRLYLDSPQLMQPKPGDAGYDIPAYGDYQVFPGQRIIINTGIAIEIPPGYVGLVWNRSKSFTTDVIVGAGGVIDSSYRGELRVKLHNHGDLQTILNGDRIAQLVIVPHFSEAVEEVAALSETERGDKGFGSSGR